MTVDIPQSLLTEIAERRCVLFLGAGVSAAAQADNGQRPPLWELFLEAGIELISNEKDKEAATSLLKDKAYLDAAQVIVDTLGAGDFALFIRGQLEDPGYKPSELHELILSIDPKVIVTTNYDKILETLATQGAAKAGYNVCKYYDSHLVNDLRSDRRIIVKAHGCVSDPQKIVLSAGQYFTARHDYPQFFTTLDALFLTSTILFIGSGFTGDPDIQLVLQNTNISAPSAHPHYAIVPAGRHPAVQRSIEHVHNVKFLEYEAGEHKQVVETLRQLSTDVAAYRSVPS
jgi:hypothetical protein